MFLSLRILNLNLRGVGGEVVWGGEAGGWGCEGGPVPLRSPRWTKIPTSLIGIYTWYIHDRVIVS